jgi:hypothetical protein
VGEKYDTYGALVGKSEIKRLLEDTDVSGWIILKWILQEQDGSLWTGFIWLRTETGGGLL